MCSVVVNTMVTMKTYIYVAFLVVLSFVGGDEAKGSVVFVIDDTSSMRMELEQVKARTGDIFEAVLKSNASQIDEFIIVTFNDPDSEFRVKTNDSLQFKSALEKITPLGGNDCPEMSMNGILLALVTSKPHSFLYVFTDASAKDYLLYDYVKALAQEKSTQVNFILTGDCDGNTKTINKEQHAVYDNLAAATSGQVFHVFKDDVNKIFEYILPNLRSKRINLLRKTYGHHICENSAFTVDSKVGDILIALSSPAPINHNGLVVLGPHGDKTSLEGLVQSEKTSIFKMRGEPGEYTINIENCTDITVVVSAPTSVSFRHGFPYVKPITLDETSTKPVHVKTKIKAAKVNMIIVNITEKSEVTSCDEHSLMLTCKVEGFPEPSIIWEDQYHNVLPSKLTRKTPPYEYMSTLHLDKATESGPYTCKAKNFEEDSESIKVVMEKNFFFNVLEYPKDTAVKFGESVELNLRIDSKPPAKIIWYQNNTEISSNNNFHVSVDSSVLNITNAQPGLQGKYKVKASNCDKQVEYEFHVTVTELPIIDKSKIRYEKLINRSVDIECRLIQGKPEPVISWSFDRDSAGKFKQLKETRDKVHIDHVTKNDVGTYRCKVSNLVGTDHHEMQLYVKYAPVVKIPRKYLDIKKGERVKLACEVDGSPAPIVRWFVNGSQIYNGRKYTINKDYTLSFTGLISDSGTYTCEASNDLKTVRAEVSVFIYVPIKIKNPVESNLNVKLGNTLILSCEVNGYPEPKVQWVHYPRQKITGIPEFNIDKNNNLIIEAVRLKDEGSYWCIARNYIDSDEITYTVNVQDIVMIDRKMVTNDLQVVEGDLSFVLTCPATGIPKPTIKWQHDGVELGSDALYKTSNDGSLTVNNVVSRHRGTYTCIAQNQFSKDTMNYEVYVHPYPPNETNPRIITIIEGEKEFVMFCGTTLETEFVVRWYKDGVFIKEGVLTLIHVTKDDAGFYTCRLSTPRRSYSFHKRVIVGSKPKFITAHNPTIMFDYGAEATLDCSATGDPLPKIIWWFENTRIINADSNQYSFKLDVKNMGDYSCSVSNEFGITKRSFKVIAGECLMSVKNDFTARQPMLVTGKNKLGWPILNVSGGTLRMQKYRKFTLVCPNASITYNNTKYGSILETSCVGDSMFELRGMALKASEITCDRPIVPLAKNRSNSVCRGKNTKLFYVGFDVNGTFASVFSVCWNEIMNTTLFVTHQMHKAIADTIPKYEAEYTRGTLLRIQFEDIYDCRNQEYAISSYFKGKPVEKCCFKRRQLVNPMDVLPGISQVATYHYLNVVPHWSCGTENWEEVERRVRQYAINSQDKIRIWTGATSVIKDVPTINLIDKLGQEIQVPQFIWKVVQHQLAIIHINVPGLTLHQAKDYTLCFDMCDAIDWMRNSQWHDYDKGFIYCCAIKDFEKAFNYNYIFN